MTERQVMLVGGGMTKFAADRADASVRDLVVEAVLAAVADAGVALTDVEQGLTSYESDHFNRQMTLGAILHDHIGMMPKPNLRVEGGGATGALALRTAFAYVKSGLCDSIIVYGGETNGKSVSSATAQQLFALSSDADWEMMVGGSYTAYYAAMIREHMRLYGTTERHFAYVAVKNRANARLQPAGATTDVDHNRGCAGVGACGRPLSTARLQPAVGWRGCADPLHAGMGADTFYAVGSAACSGICGHRLRHRHHAAGRSPLSLPGAGALSGQTRGGAPGLRHGGDSRPAGGD